MPARDRHGSAGCAGSASPRALRRSRWAGGNSSARHLLRIGQLAQPRETELRRRGGVLLRHIEDGQSAVRRPAQHPSHQAIAGAAACMHRDAGGFQGQRQGVEIDPHRRALRRARHTIDRHGRGVAGSMRWSSSGAADQGHQAPARHGPRQPRPRRGGRSIAAPGGRRQQRVIRWHGEWGDPGSTVRGAVRRSVQRALHRMLHGDGRPDHGRLVPVTAAGVTRDSADTSVSTLCAYRRR